MDDDVFNESSRIKQSDCTSNIKVNDLKKVYSNGYQALRGISFGVESSQIFGLLGPNGAGKSTIINILTSLISKSDGSVKLNNIPIQSGL